MTKHVAIFGSARCVHGSADYETAFAVGKGFAERGWAIVNGGYAGVMEASAHGARQAGGRAIGVTTREFKSKVNAYITEEKKVASWQERVMTLMTLADVYVVLQGGTGTLVEFSVAIEMMNKKLIPEKPVIICSPFWDRVRKVLEENEEINLHFVHTAKSVEDIFSFV